MNHNFRLGCLPEAIYDMLDLQGPISLKEFYEILYNVTHSSIRRTLYDLQDKHVVEKTKNDKWKLV